ncbi:MAG: spore germination protein, partial [Oscillospiraceae bacterium]
MGYKEITTDYKANLQILDSILDYGKNFDIVTKDYNIGEKKARIYLVDGFAKDATILKMMMPSLTLKAQDMEKFKTIKDYADKEIGYIETQISSDSREICTAILSGPVALIIEGFNEVLLIDAREYPTRSLKEPDSDRALRGARDGFAETLIVNTALIRRNIRSPRLATEHFSVGKISKTDVVVCYLKGKCDQKLVEKLKYKLRNLNVNSLSMKQESLAEALIDRGWYNPFPKVRYTERPDCAAASIDEGGIVILVDGTPAAMLLPTA